MDVKIYTFMCISGMSLVPKHVRMLVGHCQVLPDCNHKLFLG